MNYSSSGMVLEVKLDKIAELELNKDHSQWEQEILEQFFEKFQSIPPQYTVDVVITNKDENKGYAKGSVVVGGSGKQVNFPLIVRNYMLAPFDVMIGYNAGQAKYMPATAANIEKELLSVDYGMPAVGPYSSYDESVSLKRPGGIPAKVPVIQEDIAKFSSAPTWRDGVTAADHKAFITKLADNPEVPASFRANSGSLMDEVIDLNTERGEVSKPAIQGRLDFSDVVKAKQAITVVDTMLFDPDHLVQIPVGHAAELRMNEFPSLEQFLESSDNSVLRGLSTDMGRPVSGLVVAVDTESDDSYNKGKKFFVSARGGEYSISNGHSTLVGPLKPNDDISYHDRDQFYGSDLTDEPRVVNGIADMLRNVKQIWAGNRVKYDKGFVPKGNRVYDRDDDDSSNGPICCSSCHESGLAVLYKTGSEWRAYLSDGMMYRQANVNGSPVYLSDRDGVCLIAAPVSKPTLVSKVDSPEYVAMTSKAKKIVLIPDTAIVLNLAYMKSIDCDKFLKPGKSVRMALINAGIEATTVDTDEKQAGFRLGGPSVDPLFLLLGIDKTASLSPEEALAALMVVGCDKNTAGIAMTKSAEFSACGKPKTVTVFGTRHDYVDTTGFEHREKLAGIPGLLDQYARTLKKDLVKEASLIQDPDAVDAVLSLNFINRENLMSYVESIPRIEKVIQDLAVLLVASRMGLQQVNESALKSAMEGLDETLKGLYEIKTSLGV